jgi:ABC-2 type transport system permease protein
MSGTLFMLTLRKNWGKMLGWGIVLGILNFITILAIPNMDALQQYQELLGNMPAGVMQAFGIDVSQQLTPDSFVGSLLFARTTLFLAIYAVFAGLSITSGEEDSGIMDVVATLPVPRWRILIERFLGHALLTVGVVLMLWLGIFIGTFMVEMEFTQSILFAMSIGTIPLVLTAIAITTFLGTVLRYRGQLIAVVAVVIATSYFLDVLGSAVSEGILPAMSRLSFFAYNTAADIVRNGGLVLGDMLILSVAIVVLMAGATFFWQRRDIGL